MVREIKRNGRDIIVIGGSAGGIGALKAILEGLSDDLPASVLSVTHLHPSHVSILPQLLGQCTRLRVVHPVDGETLQHGSIYLAPPDQHMVLDDGLIRLNGGPRENYSRPSINPLFRSAAHYYGSRVIGVILSGMLDDGTAGLIAVKMHGGIAIVQSPGEAEFSQMPESASKYIRVDYNLPVAEIGPLLGKLCREPSAKGGSEVVAADKNGKKSVNLDTVADERNRKKNGNPTGGKSARKIREDIKGQERSQHEGQSFLVCPDCNGPMWEFRSGGLKQFQCRVGHKYSPETLIARHGEILERALWVTIRTLEERASLLQEMANQTPRTGADDGRRRLLEDAKRAGDNAEAVRKMFEAEKSAEGRFAAESRRVRARKR